MKIADSCTNMALLPRAVGSSLYVAKLLPLTPFPKMKKVILSMNPEQGRVLDEIELYGTILFSNPDSTTILFDNLWGLGKNIRYLKGQLYGTSRRTVKALQTHGL